VCDSKQGARVVARAPLEGDQEGGTLESYRSQAGISVACFLEFAHKNNPWSSRVGMVSVGDLDENLREPDLGVVEAVPVLVN
jgi:hypothetical protein